MLSRDLSNVTPSSVLRQIRYPASLFGQQATVFSKLALSILASHPDTCFCACHLFIIFLQALATNKMPAHDGSPDDGYRANVVVPEIRFENASNNIIPERHVSRSSTTGSRGLPVYDPNVPLDVQLFNIVVYHAKAGVKSFWPSPLWRALVTRDSIRAELSKSNHSIDTEEASRLAKYITDHQSGTHIIVFTILCLLGKLSTLEHILQHCQHNGIWDHDLPLRLKKNDRGELGLFGPQDRQVSHCCLNYWTIMHMEAFNDLQRRLTPPIFDYQGDDNTIPHLVLDAETILPWCEIQENHIPVSAMSGGYGSVSRVKIHPMCHGFSKTLRAVSLPHFS